MNLQMTIIQINIEGGNLMDWIDDLEKTEKTKKDEELKREEIRLHNAKIIEALFPQFWERLVKQIISDCEKLREKFADDMTYHVRIDTTAHGLILTGEAAPPLRRLSIQPNFNGHCITIFGGSLDKDIKVTVTKDDNLLFVWGGVKKYTTEQDLSEALIKYGMNYR